MVVLAVFVGTLLFAAEQAHTQPLQSSYNAAVLAIFERGESGLPGLTSPLASAGDFHSDMSVLDNDMDNDGHDDRAPDSLAAVLILVLTAVLSVVLLLMPLVGGRLPLALCEPSKLSSVGVLVIERPG